MNSMDKLPTVTPYGTTTGILQVYYRSGGRRWHAHNLNPTFRSKLWRSASIQRLQQLGQILNQLFNPKSALQMWSQKFSFFTDECTRKQMLWRRIEKHWRGFAEDFDMPWHQFIEKHSLLPVYGIFASIFRRWAIFYFASCTKFEFFLFPLTISYRKQQLLQLDNATLEELFQNFCIDLKLETWRN